MKIGATIPIGLLLAACGGGGGSAGTSGAATNPPPPPAATVQEQQCNQAGWRSEVLTIGSPPGPTSQSRRVLWKAPAGAWSNGALVVMHGGGGQHTNFCVANVELIAPQVRFTELALAQGFAVFLLDSADQITDNAGQLCGKVWDDELRSRANLDLPFIDEVLGRLIPPLRPPGSRQAMFLVGHSSGGYMAVRAATHVPERVSAFVPVASGDPYGWTRDCTRRDGDRPNVAGVGHDNEAGRVISESGACSAAAFPNEKPWDGGGSRPRPPFRVFHHAQDGINDRSCVDKVRNQLVARGYPESPPFTLDGGARSVDVHYRLDAYNAPLLAWLAGLPAR